MKPQKIGKWPFYPCTFKNSNHRLWSSFFLGFSDPHQHSHIGAQKGKKIIILPPHPQNTLFLPKIELLEKPWRLDTNKKFTQSVALIPRTQNLSKENPRGHNATQLSQFDFGIHQTPLYQPLTLKELSKTLQRAKSIKVKLILFIFSRSSINALIKEPFLKSYTTYRLSSSLIQAILLYQMTPVRKSPENPPKTRSSTCQVPGHCKTWAQATIIINILHPNLKKSSHKFR